MIMPMPLKPLLAVGAFLILSLAARADIELIDIEDKVYRTKAVKLLQLEGKLWIAFGPEFEKRKPAEDIVEIRFKSLELRTAFKPSDVRFVFTNGDHVSGKIAGPGKAPDTVLLNTENLGPIELPFTEAARIEFLANRAQIREDIENEEGEDIFLETSENQPHGYLVELKPDETTYMDLFDDTVTFSIENKDLAAVYLAKREPPADPKGLFAIVTLKDGSTLRGSIKEFDGAKLTFHTVYKKNLDILIGEIAGIYFRNGRVVYLSDVEPDETDENPNYIRGLKPSDSDLSFPMQRDLNVKGSELSLRGKTFTKGLGVHARSVLVYNLAGGFTKFKATIGIDDVAGGLGNVRFQVIVDGKTLYSSDPITGESPAEEIEIDVKGAQELKLAVRFGEEGNTGDCADWAMARLIR
jgi:hypothetical protein